ncbi:MAG TPA: M23 family metallopeptidase, partial [Sphingomicrobium sp.]|nr:M23 family metallopeptidase [Sphingomicrobium sp.]
FGGPGKLSAFIVALPGQFGKETGLDHDRLQLRVKGPIYSRIVTVEKGAPVRIDIGFDPSTGLISSLGVKPAAGKGKAVPPRAARTRLTLPFSMPRPGHLWALSHGGAQVIDNYHNRLDTFYAIDISPRAMNSLATPATPADAPCWDLPILAAAPGTVAIARDGMADEPKLGINGNPAGGPGNHVIIDHGNGEFTLYAHLRQGSVIGKPGDRVARGQQVGRCGNSASPGPHLHFQLMDGSDLDTARGLPLVFHDYYAPLRYVEQGTIVRGDVVLPAIPLGKAIPKQAGRASIGKPAARSR